MFMNKSCHWPGYWLVDWEKEITNSRGTKEEKRWLCIFWIFNELELDAKLLRGFFPISRKRIEIHFVRFDDLRTNFFFQRKLFSNQQEPLLRVHLKAIKYFCFCCGLKMKKTSIKFSEPLFDSNFKNHFELHPQWHT